MNIESALKSYWGISLRTETKMMFWGGDIWMVKDRKGKLLLETHFLADALKTLTEDAEICSQSSHRTSP